MPVRRQAELNKFRGHSNYLRGSEGRSTEITTKTRMFGRVPRLLPDLLLKTTEFRGLMKRLRPMAPPDFAFLIALILV
jgi:hypothetical protein